jgi:hypothetical protein
MIAAGDLHWHFEPACEAEMAATTAMAMDMLRGPVVCLPARHGMSIAAGLVAQKNLFDRHAENIGYAKRQWQRRVIFSGLNCIHRLPRDTQRIGQILLAPVALGAEDF